MVITGSVAFLCPLFALGPMSGGKIWPDVWRENFIFSDDFFQPLKCILARCLRHDPRSGRSHCPGREPLQSAALHDTIIPI